MQWHQLTSEEQLQEIINKSKETPQIIFKHSTRCSISSVALHRLQKSEPPNGVDFYFLDLLTNRQLSNKIADTFSVRHESPQVLVIKNGECVYDESHLGISMHDIVDQLKAA
ncbi:MAG: bacillithiol system redox-active protein YtxJ [Flavisolibacter sp.]|nr:bacillithiol system redox-active protein YtxJ [Flavisolibacter sp.]